MYYYLRDEYTPVAAVLHVLTLSTRYPHMQVELVGQNLASYEARQNSTTLNALTKKKKPSTPTDFWILAQKDF